MNIKINVITVKDVSFKLMLRMIVWIVGFSTRVALLERMMIY